MGSARGVGCVVLFLDEAEYLSRETITAALPTIAQRAGRIFKFFAQEALRAHGELIPSVRPNVTVEARREPLGVVGLITPWNWPLNQIATKVAPAIAAASTPHRFSSPPGTSALSARIMVEPGTNAPATGIASSRAARNSVR